jgi:hypothetical protein
MGDEREERSGTGQEGVAESLLRDATSGSTGEDPDPPDEPQAAAMPRRSDRPDAEEGSGR